MKFSILLFLSIFPISIFPQSLPGADIQSWNDLTITRSILKTKDKGGKDVERISIFFSGTLRIGNRVKTLIDERIGVGFDFKINHFLTITPSYFYRTSKPNLNGREYESRFRFAATLEKKWARFSIKDRNLIEYRMRNSKSDSTRYRNKFTISYPIFKDDKELFSPFISDEPFYDFTAKNWTRNEISVGITRKFNRNFSTDFYYLRQDNRSGNPKSLNIIGIGLKVKID